MLLWPLNVQCHTSISSNGSHWVDAVDIKSPCHNLVISQGQYTEWDGSKAITSSGKGQCSHSTFRNVCFSWVHSDPNPCSWSYRKGTDFYSWQSHNLDIATYVELPNPGSWTQIGPSAHSRPLQWGWRCGVQERSPESW